MSLVIQLRAPSEAVAGATTTALEDMAKLIVEELRARGRALEIEGDRAHHADALRAVESLASSARVAELIQRAAPANDTGE